MRVPLGWTSGKDMCVQANSLEKENKGDTTQKQTVEMRSPDASADVYQLMAGLCVACRYGLEMDKDKALGIAADKYVGLGESGSDNDKFEQLPDCCVASADWLTRHRAIYEAEGVFSPRMIDGIISKLRACDDANLREAAEKDAELMQKLVRGSFYCG